MTLKKGKFEKRDNYFNKQTVHITALINEYVLQA